MDMGRVASPAGTRVTTIALAFTLVAGTVVFLRLFTRLVLTRVTGFEDACIVLAMVLSISLTVMTSQQGMNGLGMRASELTVDERVSFLRALWSGLWIYSLALMFTKISILIQYLRIFPVRRFQKACFVVLGVVAACGAWALFGNIFLCSPIASFWDTSVKDGNCMDRGVIWFTNAGLNIAQDIVILLLPMPLIQMLQISKSQKRGLVFMLALGTSVSLVSVIRLHSLDKIVKSNDLPFDNPAHAALSAVEVNVAIICACLPAMRPLLALMMPKYFSAASHYTNVRKTLDLDGPSIHHKTVYTPPNSTRSNTPRTYTPNTNTPRVGTPQTPRPTLSRNSSGHFIIHHSRPDTPVQAPTPTPTPGQMMQLHHSKSGSNISIDIAAAEARSNKLRAEDRPHPLRSSPITASRPRRPPRSPTRLSLQSIGPGFFTIKPSKSSERMRSESTRPEMAVAGRDKHLPLTPFPVGTAF
ncbi:hypothetical protein CC86DRAFT_367820 [Ophiobolus disseminans]|uniref:Rhodopsin domain-containing protein n=1 Tax=Ophiobolus disseminans TaxID=1469910 RepID=A0A6A7A9D6_9PLEO|nr:hypothetical protein CC86DRAFT_367820 [Ophiobolus disseminans]